MRIAIIGAGWTGRRQIEAAGELDGTLEIASVMDIDRPVAEEAAGELGVPHATDSLENVLGNSEIDAVSICTPHKDHRDQSVAAAEAGKHVLVTKPIAMTVADAQEMIAAARANNVKLYVHEEEVYRPQSGRLRDVVASGEHVGEVVSASFAFGFRAEVFRYPGRRAWLTRPDLGGTGTWMLHGIHSMAKLRYVFGEAESIYLREHHATTYATPEIEGTVTGLIRFESGVCVSVLHTCESKLSGNWTGIRLFGTTGVVHATDDGFVCESFGESASSSEPTPYPTGGLSSHALVLKAFVEYAEHGVAGPTTAESETRSLAIVEAGYESIRTGRAVDVLRPE